jgi:hypothetical protein
MLGRLAGVPTGSPHRLSGHPSSLAGKLVLAKRQVAHDRSPGSHHWLGRDRVYVNQLQQLIAPPLGPSWLVNAFWCIHRYEGAWNAHTGNGYYGGLQFDYSFMRSYGREFLARYGTADRWPPGVQIHVAIRAYLSGRGFYPWPLTARRCGLL